MAGDKPSAAASVPALVTTDIGRQAEQAAAEYLARQGFTVLHRNWRRRDCEIDIVARRHAAVYFVEVKYRATDGSGSGLEYVTAKKLQRMAYAASRWVQEHGWAGEQQLAAIEVSGEAFAITAFIDDIY